MHYDQIASDEVIAKVVMDLKERNVTAIVVGTKEQALEEVKKLIPAGGAVMNGSSATLEQIGFVEYLKDGHHGWNNVHELILNEQDPIKKARLRKEGVLADYFLGSVNAVTEVGQLVFGSGSGSQLASYVYTSDNIILVAGANKIVLDLDAALKRIGDYVVPLEDARIKSMGRPGVKWSRTLILEREIMPSRHTTLILVKEVLGF
jgi:imidazoleglycerol phosphate dehydratase HisB